MARNLYRVYLYHVASGCLIAAAVGANLLLDSALSTTQLRGSGYPAPSHDDVVQRLILAVVLWVIVGILGGLHYWLIRRDLRQHPQEAGGGGVRAFFLNAIEVGAVLTAVTSVTALLGQWASSATSPGFNAASPLATALIALALTAVVEWERRHTTVTTRTAHVFQRLHLHGLPLVLALTVGITSLQSAVRETMGFLLNATGQYPACPTGAFSQFPPGPCYSQTNVLPLWLSALFVAGVWAVYARVVRADVHSAIRQVAHLIGFIVAVIITVVGIDRGLELALRALLREPVAWTDLATSYDFLSVLVSGVVVALAYGLWLRRESASLPMGAANARLVAEAFAAAALTVPLWWGFGVSLHNAIEAVSSSTAPDGASWATGLALLITGLLSIPLVIDLQRTTVATGETHPYRAFIFGLVAAGALAGAVGASIALYALGTSLLGAKLANWQATARTGLALFITGAAVVAIYGWQGLRQGYFKQAAAKQPEQMPAGAPADGAEPTTPASPVTPVTIEDVLDAFGAGTLTRDEAAQKIRFLAQQRPLPA